MLFLLGMVSLKTELPDSKSVEFCNSGLQISKLHSTIKFCKLLKEFLHKNSFDMIRK